MELIEQTSWFLAVDSTKKVKKAQNIKSTCAAISKIYKTLRKEVGTIQDAMQVK